MGARKCAFLTVAAAVMFCSYANAQTIPELAATSRANPVVRGRVIEVPPATLEDLTKHAELIVDGRITRLRSYLTPDQNEILTDFQIVPNRVFAGSIPAERSTPGSSTPPLLTVYGGQLTISGVTVSVIDHGMVSLEDGGRYLLFLDQFQEPGRYQLHGAAAFRIRDGRVNTILTHQDHAYRKIADMPLDAIINEIVRFAPDGRGR